MIISCIFIIVGCCVFYLAKFALVERDETQHKHKKGKPCYDCIAKMEIECDIRETLKPPRPPKEKGGSSLLTPNERRGLYFELGEVDRCKN